MEVTQSVYDGLEMEDVDTKPRRGERWKISCRSGTRAKRRHLVDSGPQVNGEPLYYYDLPTGIAVKLLIKPQS